MTDSEPTPVPPPPKVEPAASVVDVVAGTVLSMVAGGIAGALAGFVWGGIGGRIAMRVLFLTSGDVVKGVTSDDGFEIGRLSTDSIFLVVGMTFLGGILGAGYGLVRMLFRGSPWLTAGGISLAVGAGAGGGLIVSSEGIDFRLLGPLWLAIGLFVFLPAAWTMTVGVVTERLLHLRSFGSEPLPGIDARPLGLLGDAIGWTGIALVTAAGVLDLVDEIERLT
jgi:hypothetical protein